MPKRASARDAVARNVVTVSAASKLGAVFHALVARGQTRVSARRFALQCGILLFLEDSGVFPDASFRDFVRHFASGEKPHRNVREWAEQFNLQGSFLEFLKPIEWFDLDADVASLLANAANERWSAIDPSIFGELLQATMTPIERHERGVHYTPNNAILDYVVRPTLVDPWRARIHEASTLDELRAVRYALT